MYKVRTIKAQEDYAMDGKLPRLKCHVYTQVRWAQTEEHRLKLKYALTSAHVDKAYTCLLSHTHIKNRNVHKPDSQSLPLKPGKHLQ